MARVCLKRLLLGLLACAAALLALLACRALILPLGLALALCYVLLPPVKKLEGWGLPCWLAILLVYLAVFAGLGLAACWGLPRLWRDLAAIGELAPQTVSSCRELWQGLSAELPQRLGLAAWPKQLSGCAEKFVSGLGESLYAWLARSLRLLPSFFGNLSMLIFAPVFAFYFLRDREKIRSVALSLLPAYWRHSLRPLFAELNALLRGFVRGYFLVAVCVGLLFYLLLWLFGVKYSFTLGLIMTVAELIPYLGPLLAFGPSLLLTLTQGRAAVVKLLLIWLAVQQLENLVISPRIMAGSVRLHPLYVIFAVLVGGFWFGVPGMIAAVPLAACLGPVAGRLFAWWRQGLEERAGREKSWL